MDKPIKRMLPYTEEWERQARRLAMDFCPNILPCVHCGHPVVSGYRCTNCDSHDPSGTQPERDEFRKWVLNQQRTSTSENAEVTPK